MKQTGYRHFIIIILMNFESLFLAGCSFASPPLQQSDLKVVPTQVIEGIDGDTIKV